MTNPGSASTPEPDPTKVTNQPSLTTSTGRIWLVVGGLFALIAAVMLFFLMPFAPHGLAAVAAEEARQRLRCAAP